MRHSRQMVPCICKHVFRCARSCGYMPEIDEQPQQLVAKAMTERAEMNRPQYILNVGPRPAAASAVIGMPVRPRLLLSWRQPQHGHSLQVIGNIVFAAPPRCRATSLRRGYARTQRMLALSARCRVRVAFGAHCTCCLGRCRGSGPAQQEPEPAPRL